jgi:hypothetical protein
MRVALVLSLLASLSCTTTFYGAAKVPNGAAGCKAICTSYGMELTGMVALGDYSDGCICELPAKHASTAAAASAAAAVAAETAMVERQNAAKAEHHQ